MEMLHMLLALSHSSHVQVRGVEKPVAIFVCIRVSDDGVGSFT